MSKRAKHPGGRPPRADIASDVTFRARMTEAERKRLDLLAAEWGGDASRLVRAWVAEGRLPRRSPDEPGV